MPLSPNIVQQYVVEFISDPTIGGVYTNGVRDSSSTSGPWTWVVPSGVTLLRLDSMGAGGGGGAGWSTGQALAGGAGGGCGRGIVGMDVHVYPGASLTITVGAGGTGGVSGGANATGGGTTTLAGLTRPYFWRLADSVGGVEGTLAFLGGPSGGAATATASGGTNQFGNTLLYGTSAVNNGTTGLSGTGYNWHAPCTSATNFGNPNFYGGGRLWGQGAAAGGAANTTPTSSGGNGGGISVGGDLYNAMFTEGSNFNNGVGNTVNIAGTDYSRGGGGSGSHSFVDFGGIGGDGGSPGTNGGIGAGGGGGGGGANGGGGGNGYVRFIYWSAS